MLGTQQAVQADHTLQDAEHGLWQYEQVPSFLNAGARQFGFMLRGLKLMQPKLEALNIPFFLLKGDPVQTVPELVQKTGASLLVTDFAPLRLGRKWRDEASTTPPHLYCYLDCPVPRQRLPWDRVHVKQSCAHACAVDARRHLVRTLPAAALIGTLGDPKGDTQASVVCRWQRT